MLTPADKLAKEALELQNQKAHEVDEAKKKERQVAAIACGLAVECGCCFDSYAPVSRRLRVVLIDRKTQSSVKLDTASVASAWPSTPTRSWARGQRWERCRRQLTTDNEMYGHF